MPKYRVNGDIYNIPEEKVSAFEKRYPNATVDIYDNDGAEYSLPVSEKVNFQKQFRNWSYTAPAAPSAPSAEKIDSEEQPGPVMPNPDSERNGQDYSLGWKAAGSQVVGKADTVPAPQKTVKQPEVEQPQDNEVRTYLEAANRKQVAGLSDDIDVKLNNALTRLNDAGVNEWNEVKKGGLLSKIGYIVSQNSGNPDVPSVRTNPLKPENRQIVSEVNNLEAAKNAMTNARELIEEADKSVNEGDFGGFVKGSLRGFGDKLFDVRTWDMGASDSKDNVALYNALKKFDKGEKLTESEQMLLDAKSVELATNAYFGSYIGRGYKAGMVTAQSLPFMIEMAVNPASATGTSVQSRLAKYALDRFSKKGVSRAATILGTKAAGMAGRAVGDAAGAAIMAGTTGAMRVAGDAVDRINGSVETDVDENGRTIFAGHEKGESTGKAIAKAFTSNAIENHSEMLGEYFEPALGRLTKLGKSGMNKIGLGKVTKFIDEVHATDAAKLIDDFQEHTKWNGTIGEYAEEVVGNIENAILVGDSTLDSSDDTGVFNLDQNIDTFLGVALMGGVFSTIRTASWRTPKYRARKEMEKARDEAKKKFGDQAWQDIEDRLAEAGDEGMSSVLSEVIIGERNLEREKAILDYAKSIKIYEGTLKGDEKHRELSSPEMSDLESSYENGYTLATPQEVHDAKIMFEYQQARLQQALGMSSIDIETLMLGNEMGKLTEEQKSVALDYLNAEATFDGVIDRVRDDIDNRISSVNAAIDASTNSDTGKLQPARLVDDRAVHIISGIVRLTPDGTMVDIHNSEDYIIIRDDKTGKIESVSPSQIVGVDAEIDPESEKKAAESQIRGQIGQQKADIIDGVLQFNPGDVYTLTNEQGQSFTVQIAADKQGIVDNGDGTINVILNEDIDANTGLPRISQMSKEQIENMAEATNMARLQQYEQQKLDVDARQYKEDSTGRTPENPFKINDRISFNDVGSGSVKHGIVESELTDDGKYEIAIENDGSIESVSYLSPEDLSNMQAQLVQSVEEQEAPEIEQNPVEIEQPEQSQVSAFERIPKDEQGNPIYEQAETPELAWDAIVEQTDGDEAMAQTVTDGMVADKETALKKVEKAKSKGGATIAEKIAAEKERKAAIEEAKANLAVWKQIAQIARRRKDAEESEKRRIAEEQAAIRKAEEEKLRAEREEAERIKREALNGVPDISDDTPQDARARGYRRVSGHKVDRQEPIPHLQGNDIAVKFSDDVIVPGRVAVIEAETLQPSHIQGTRNPAHFIDESQPKERTDDASVLSARKIARNIRPEEITSSITAYTGAPTTNVRGEVIQGNNRSDALRLIWEGDKEQSAIYKQYLMDHAADFGLNADEISAMNHPVLVNMLDVDDATAITLGQFVAQDTESGGTERIKPKNAVQKMGADMRTFADMLLASSDDETSFAGLVDRNGDEVLAWMNRRGFITPTQYKSAFDSKGGITAEAKNDLKGIMYQSIFTGGNIRLEEMFNAMPAKAQRAILATAFRDNESPNTERMVKEIQNSIRAYNALSQGEDFANAKNWKEARLAVESWKMQYAMDDVTGESYLPAEKFSNFALHLATMYKGESQSLIQSTFNHLYDLIQGTQEETLFEKPDNTPRTLAQAILETLNFEYDGQQRSNVLAGDSTASQEREQGSTGTPAAGERVEGGEQPSDNTGGTENESGSGEVREKIAEEGSKVNTNPSDAQKEAGNYRMGHVKIDGMDVTIENPKGSIRKGRDADGKEWQSEMHNDYGYIRGTKAVDNDHIDIFLSDNPETGNVFVVDQVNPKTGEFDESKVMYGFASEQEARDAYLSNYEKGWKGLGKITEVTKEEFKKWIDSSTRKTKPFSEYASVKAAKPQKEKPVQGIEGYSRDEIKGIVADHINDVMRDNDIHAEIIGMDIHGSRNRHDARPDSDLDVVVEYSGDIREDDMFNALNGEEDALSIEGIKVDINPIRKEETGDLQDYMKQSEEYDREKSEHAKQKGASTTSEIKNNKSGKIEDYGEQISGARKDMLHDLAKSVQNTSIESLISLPFSKAFKKPNLSKAVEEGALRDKDARFAQAAIAAFLSTKKPVAGTKDERRRQRWGEKTNVEKWAEKAYTGIKMLQELFDADERVRDKVIEAAVADKYVGVAEAKAQQQRIGELNHREFNGTSYPLNLIALYNEVFDRLGYPAGQNTKIPVGRIVCSSTFDSYSLRGVNGEDWIYPSRSLKSFEDVVDELVYLIKVANADETAGNVALFQMVDKILSDNSPENRLAYEAVSQMLSNAGIPVELLSNQAMREMAINANALETVSSQNEYQQTVVSSASGAKIINNLDNLAKSLENEPKTKEKTFLGALAKALDAKKHGSNSQYATFEAKNGTVVTIRLANHNAATSTFDNHEENDGISIVVSARENNGITNDGKAHVTEFYYDAIKLRKADGKPLVDIVKSIKQSLYSGEYKDTTGLAQREEVNAKESVEFLREPDGTVYGATVGGKIYLNRERLNPNTPIHEYTHLWFSALKDANPELYKRGVELMKQLPIWEEVKTDPNYAELSGDDAIASECLSRLVGDRGADKLTELAKKAMVRGDIIGTANRISLIEDFKDWLKKFWTWVRDSFAPWTKEETSRVSVDDIQNMVLSDLAKGVNPLARQAESDPYIRFSIVKDPKLIEELDKGAKVKVYRAMQLIDGKLYPPMASKINGEFVRPIELGKWEQADEHPELIDKNGRFNLNKGNGKGLKAAYNPYIHTSRTPLNDQFSEAQSRPNIVTVEVEIPKSELSSGYQADKAKDSVGEMEWKAGIVQGQLTGKRKVILSRWDKPIRIVPDSEVANVIVNDMFKGRTITMPSNVVTPSLRAELEKLGVPFVQTDNTGHIVGGQYDGKYYSKVYGNGALAGNAKDNRMESETDRIVREAKENGTYMKAPNGKPTNLNERQWAQVRTRAFKKWFGDWEKAAEESPSTAKTNSSKIVDENGEPKVVYHGSPYRFFRFDKTKLGQATGADSAKEGFFFTDNKELAELFSRYSLESLPVSDVEQLVKDRLLNMSENELNDAYEVYRNDSPDYLDYADETDSPNDRDYLEIRGFLLDGVSEEEAKREYIQDSIESKIEGGYFSDMEEVEEELSSIGIEFGNNEQVFLNIESPLVDEVERDYFHNGEDVSPMTPVLQNAKRMGSDGVVFTGIVESGQKGAANQYVAFEPNQIKSATDNVGTFDVGQEDIRYRDSGQMDAEYMFAIESGDMRKAGRMVEAAFRKAFPGSKVKNVVYHGVAVSEDGRQFPYNSIRDGHFTDDEGFAEYYAGSDGYVYKVFLDIESPLEQDFRGQNSDFARDAEGNDVSTRTFARRAKDSNGRYDGAIITNVDEYGNGIVDDGTGNYEGTVTDYIPVRPEQVYSAEPVVYDDNGQVIPLSRRFENGNPDIRYKHDETGNASRTSQDIEAAATKLAESLGEKVRIVRDVNEIEHQNKKVQENQRKSKGWFNTDAREIVVVLPNATGIEDVQATILHEAVGHKGLRELVGDDRFDDFLDKVYAAASLETRKKIVDPAKQNHWDFRLATEEYIAGLAENGFAGRENRTLFEKIKDFFRDMLSRAKIALGVNIGDNELRYMLWRTYQMRTSRGILAKAEDISMQQSMKVGNFRNEVPEESSRLRFRNSSNGSRKSLARDIYEEKTRIVDRKGQKTDTANLMRRLKEAYVDSMQSLKYLQDAVAEETGKPVEDFENAYLAENAMSSKNKAQTDIYLNRFFNPIKDAIRDLQKEGAEYGDIVRYLMAKHGLERNEVFSKRDAEKDGDVWDGSVRRDYSGLTELTRRETDTVAPRIDEITSRAEDIVRKFEMDHDTDVLWEKINDATKDTLRTSYITGMLTKDNYEMVRSMFRYYIPLRGWSENTASAVYDYLSDARPKTSSIVKAATGRTTISDDPIATIAYMGQSAIIQGNRNMMKQKLLNLALNHKTGLLTVNRQWEVQDPVTGEWITRNPVIPVDATPEEVADIVSQFEIDMKAAEKNGTARISRGKLDTGKHITAYEGQEHVVKVKRGGIEYCIYLNGNPRAAQAVNGMTNPDAVDSWLIRKARIIKNFMARMFTSQNPAFIISNLSRDVIFAGTAVFAKEDSKYTALYTKNIARALAKGQLIGLVHRFETGRLDDSKDIDRYFGEFIRNGGETGFTQLNTVDDFKRDLNRFAREMKQGQVMKVSSKLWNGIWDGVEFMNRCAEDVTRFSVYMTSRQMGRSVERSISDAKEITVNFNRKGSGGFGARVMNFAYIFFNAAIQALANAGKIFYEHPVKSAVALSAFSAAGFLAPLLAQAIISAFGGDDDAYWDLPEWVRRNNFVFYVPWSDNKFLIIPISQELRPFYALGEVAMSVLMGKEDVLEGLRSVGGSFMDLLPVDFMGNGNNLAVSLTPTVAQPFAQLVANSDYFGKPIYRRNDYNRLDPAWTKAYKGTSSMLINASKWLNEVTGGDDVKRGWIDPVNNPAVIEHLFESYLGGVGKTINKTAKTVSMIWNPEMRDIRNVPIVSTFVQESDDERVAGSQLNREYGKAMEEFRETEHTISGYKRKARMGSMEYADKLSDFMNTPEFKKYSKMKGYASSIAKLRTALKKTEELNGDVMDAEYLQEMLRELKQQVLEELKED